MMAPYTFYRIAFECVMLAISLAYNLQSTLECYNNHRGRMYFRESPTTWINRTRWRGCRTVCCSSDSTWPPSFSDYARSLRLAHRLVSFFSADASLNWWFVFLRLSNWVETVLSWRAERPYVFVGPFRNVRLCTASKRLNLESPIFAHVCRLTSYVRLQTFVNIANFLDFYFQSQRFESTTFGSSYVFILENVADRTNVPKHRDSHAAFRLTYLYWTLVHPKGQGRGHWSILKVRVEDIRPS